MSDLSSLNPKNVFKYFFDICSIPHSSGDMEKISDYCMDFAKKHNLKAIKDDACNVIIYKDASNGYENSESIILQGHLDMVCQKTDDCNIDFSKDGLKLLVDGDFLTAQNTTLGGDNGIAVAMIMAILASDDIPHPPIEAVFTTDEEIGMIGATKLDFNLIKSQKMINLDAEEDDTVTVSCAGGSDFVVDVPLDYETKNGTELTITLKGLKGGHSGVEIDKGRVNANILMGRVLNNISNSHNIELISISGGDKANAITNKCVAKLLVDDANTLKSNLTATLEIIKNEIKERESGFDFEISISEECEKSVVSKNIAEKIIRNLVCAPNGIIEMSAEIEGLVETSLNLGILKTENNVMTFHFALRSNKKSALIALEEKLLAFWSNSKCEIKTFGHYPPWEFKENSKLQEIYIDTYRELFGTEPKVEAIHAGLECGVFSSAKNGMDCIAIGPALYDVHTVNEKLSISSTERIFELLLKILKKSK